MTTDKVQETKWTIIGGGNGGQSAAGHLALMGFPVKLYDIFPETVNAITNQGGIQVDGRVSGFGKVELATTNLEEALEGADMVMVVTPAPAHRAIAKDCAPYLEDGQIVFLHPGATFGALEFKLVLKEQSCPARVTVAESNSLLYACRSLKPGYASIFGIKKELIVACLPAVEKDNLLKNLTSAFPQVKPGRNVLETSLGNPNAMMHPGPSLLNTSLIESGKEWLYYWDGITPSIGAFVEGMDKERLALGRAFGLDLIPILEWYRSAYETEGATLSEVVRNNKAYAEVKGQGTLLTRYILEDIPMGLAPMVSLGRKLDVDVSRMETVIKMAEYVTGRDLVSQARTIENMGLSEMSLEEILKYLETGL